MGRGSSGIGNASVKLRESIRSVEDRIRGKSTESAIIFDDDGTVLVDTSDGKRSEVSFTEEQAKMAEGKTLTHNHPNGYYFSTADLNSMGYMKLKEMRATTPDGRAFVLTTAGKNQNMGGLLRAYSSMLRSTAQQAADVAYSYSQDMSDFNHRAALAHTVIVNNWLKDNAPTYGYSFREEKTR